MTDRPVPYRLSLANIEDEVTAWEAEQKGYFEATLVIGERTVDITFYTASRLAAEIKLAAGWGLAGYAISHVIVVPEVTKEWMVKAVDEMDQKDGGFRQLLGDSGT